MSGLKWEKLVCPYNTPVRCNPVTSGGRCAGGLDPQLREGGEGTCSLCLLFRQRQLVSTCSLLIRNLLAVPPLKHKGEDLQAALEATLWDPYGPMRVPLLLIMLVAGWLRGWFVGWLAFLKSKAAQKKQRGDPADASSHAFRRCL